MQISVFINSLDITFRTNNFLNSEVHFYLVFVSYGVASMFEESFINDTEVDPVFRCAGFVFDIFVVFITATDAFCLLSSEAANVALFSLFQALSALTCVELLHLAIGSCTVPP